MTWSVKVEIFGEKELRRFLTGWTPAKQRKFLRPAVTKGTRVIAKAVKREAPAETGLLKKSIGSKVVTYKSGTVVGIAGPRKGFKRPVVVSRAAGKGEQKGSAGVRVVYRNPTKYAHLVHGGTQAHALGSGSTLRRKTRETARKGRYVRTAEFTASPGNQRGRMHPGSKPNPFIQRGFTSALPAARAVMLSEIKAQILKEVSRRAGRSLRRFAA